MMLALTATLSLQQLSSPCRRRTTGATMVAFWVPHAAGSFCISCSIGLPVLSAFVENTPSWIDATQQLSSHSLHSGCPHLQGSRAFALFWMAEKSQKSSSLLFLPLSPRPSRCSTLQAKHGREEEEIQVTVAFYGNGTKIFLPLSFGISIFLFLNLD